MGLPLKKREHFPPVARARSVWTTPVKKKEPEKPVNRLRNVLVFVGGFALILSVIFCFVVLPRANWHKVLPRSGPKVSGILAFAQKEILFKNEGEEEWRIAKTGQKFQEGMIINTVKSASNLISMGNGTVLRLDENSQIQLQELGTHSRSDRLALIGRVRLEKGRLWVEESGLDIFEVEVSNFICLMSGSSVEVRVESPTKGRVVVYRGEAEVHPSAARGKKTRIHQGQESILEGGRAPVLGVLELNEADLWQKWNLTLSSNVDQLKMSRRPIFSRQPISPEPGRSPFPGHTRRPGHDLSPWGNP